MEQERGTGRTTAQMLIAPLNALFVCLNAESKFYAVQLAKHLSRDDLRIVSAALLERPDSFRGLRVVLDHAVVERMSTLSMRQRAGVVALHEMGCLY